MTLISADELAERLASPSTDDDDRPPLVVCDVRFYLNDHDLGRREYDFGHIPGARFVDLHTQLAGGDGGGRHPLPTVERFAALLGTLGITPATFVVAYDDSGGAIASRLWWMLRSISHGQVAVLDGGFQAWMNGGHPVTSDTPTVNPSQYPVPPDWTGIVDADAVSQGAALGATIVDSRSPERFRGDVEPLDARAGHIPGAINRFHADNLDERGKHRPIHELVTRFVGVGESPVVYCGSGVTACHNLLVMSLLGITRARLYPGSWSEWAGDPDRPVATGD